jgi:AmiR/NasT family two-component response regulator
MDTRILIVDDEAQVRTSLSETLTSQGYLIVGEANDGTSAVQMSRQLRPDLVIMDITMPNMDGLTAAKIITDEELAPILLIATDSNRDLVIKARDVGAQAYLIKPLREADMMPLIEVTLSRWTEQRKRRHELGQLRERLETRVMIDRAKGILMDSQGLSEQDAFRKIQQLAMNSRKTMREVAQAILITQQIGP